MDGVLTSGCVRDGVLGARAAGCLGGLFSWLRASGRGVLAAAALTARLAALPPRLNTQPGLSTLLGSAAVAPLVGGAAVAPAKPAVARSAPSASVA